jgi:hypothetical protein
VSELVVSIQDKGGQTRPHTCRLRQALLAGYTGRDRAKVMEHIHELEKLGVTPPDRIPTIFVVPPELITTDHALRVSGPETSGEAELYLLPTPEGLLVGVGSDHTDRAHEAIDVDESKRMCPKAVSGEVWRYEDLKDHWDQVEIRSWVTDGGQRQLYQEGRLDVFLAVDDLLNELRAAGHADLDETIVFGGTLPTHGGVVYGERFEVELRDPVLNRRLTCGYDVLVPGAQA